MIRRMTRKVSYAMGVSLDGYIAGSDGGIDWTAPDEELHRFHNERAREMDVRRRHRVLPGARGAARATAGRDPAVRLRRGVPALRA